MMKSIKNQMFLLLFLSSTAFAADKPAWTIDYTKLNLPEHGRTVQFTSDNKILINSMQYYGSQANGSKYPPEKFAAALLSKENGELIKRVEWPLTPERRTWLNGIYPLPSGGYVGIINDRLQTFDSSFNVIHDRALGSTAGYYIIVSISGKFIILHRYRSGSQFRRIEIIDSGTFETVEHFDTLPNFSIVDIWGDRLLSVSYSDSEGISEKHFFEKKIGDSQWSYFGSVQQRSNANARFIYNGAIIVEDGIGRAPVTGGAYKYSWNAPVRAVRTGTQSYFLNEMGLGKGWVKAYDLNTRKALLTTKKHSGVRSYDISPDGDGIILMTEKKIEFYNIKSKKDKKK